MAPGTSSSYNYYYFLIQLAVNAILRADYFRTKSYLFSVSISAFGLLLYRDLRNVNAVNSDLRLETCVKE